MLYTIDAQPFQAKLVAAYKAAPDAKLPTASMWNNTGRGYPDIAALGGQKTPYCVVVNGGAEGVAGTSASSPTAQSQTCSSSVAPWGEGTAGAVKTSAFPLRISSGRRFESPSKE